MARKFLFSVLLGVFVMAIAGLATAEFAVAEDVGMSMTSPSLQSSQAGADPEHDYSNSATWQEREPVETGSMPAVPGDSRNLHCCSGEVGPSVDADGNTAIRPGIDDGP